MPTFELPQAIGLALCWSMLYVAVIYTHKPRNVQRSTQTGAINRNDPVLVRFRIAVISGFTLLTLCVLPWLISTFSQSSSLVKVYSQFGIFPGVLYEVGDDTLVFSLGRFVLFIRDILLSLALISLLFIGPLLDSLFFQPSSSSPLQLLREWTQQVRTIHGVRDLIVAPLTEEIVYTAGCIVILLQVPEISTNQLVFVPPLFFSVAHFHHAYEMYTIKAPIAVIVFSTLFQMTYTFLFGIFTDYLFIRQNNLWSCFAVHSFCNFMGVPSGKVDTSRFKYWNYTYYSLLVLGIYLFQKLLVPFTETGLKLHV